jgi:microcystin-dependent protein
MSAPFLCEIRCWACNFAPRGWIMCQGQLLPISQFTAMFALIGTFYGGNGMTNFALPDLRSRVPIKYGTGVSGTTYDLGEVAGVETVTVSGNQMPIHNHTFTGSSGPGTVHKANAGGSLAAASAGGSYYGPNNGSLTTINQGTLSTYVGGNQAHTNIQPYQVLNWCIASQGIFPSRN